MLLERRGGIRRSRSARPGLRLGLHAAEVARWAWISSIPPTLNRAGWAGVLAVEAPQGASARGGPGADWQAAHQTCAECCARVLTYSTRRYSLNQPTAVAVVPMVGTGVFVSRRAGSGHSKNRAHGVGVRNPGAAWPRGDWIAARLIQAAALCRMLHGVVLERSGRRVVHEVRDNRLRRVRGEERNRIPRGRGPSDPVSLLAREPLLVDRRRGSRGPGWGSRVRQPGPGRLHGPAREGQIRGRRFGAPPGGAGLSVSERAGARGADAFAAGPAASSGAVRN